MTRPLRAASSAPEQPGVPISHVPATTESLRVLTEYEARIAASLADTILPEGGELPLSATDAGFVQYFDDLLARVPRRERTLLRGMLLMFDVSTVFTEPTAMSRLSKAPRKLREANLARWDKSDLYLRRAAFQALRSLVLWSYVDNPEVGATLGIEPGTVVTRRRRRAAGQPSGSVPTTPPWMAALEEV